MADERETPFSFTEEEYAAFQKKAIKFGNNRRSTEPLFVEMCKDLPRFKDTDTCKILVDTLKDM
ncbi:hypothetical protein FACS189494_05390 [Spirochaetia bacterium]|nr:hypothetical protein FACS189494_05390 [Spirochaetia bacterium]